MSKCWACDFATSFFWCFDGEPNKPAKRSCTWRTLDVFAKYTKKRKLFRPFICCTICFVEVCQRFPQAHSYSILWIAARSRSHFFLASWYLHWTKQARRMRRGKTIIVHYRMMLKDSSFASILLKDHCQTEHTFVRFFFESAKKFSHFLFARFPFLFFSIFTVVNFRIYFITN